MRKLVLCAAVCLMAGAQSLFAAAPCSYDFTVNASDDGVGKRIPIADTISFEYWYDAPFPGDPVAAAFDMDLWGNQTGDMYNGLYLHDPTILGSIPLLGSQNYWTKVTYEMPFYDIVNPDGTDRTEEELILFWINLPFPVDTTVYIRNLHTYDTWRDIGYKRLAREAHLGDQPVPEPGTVMMLGSGLVGMLGYRVRKRKSGKN